MYECRAETERDIIAKAKKENIVLQDSHSAAADILSENAVLRKTHVMPRIFQRRPLTLGSSKTATRLCVPVVIRILYQ